MKKVILNFDETTGNLSDDNNVMMMGTSGMGCVMPNYEPPTEAEEPKQTKQAITELIQLGVNIDDIIKLRANNII